MLTFDQRQHYIALLHARVNEPNPTAATYRVIGKLARVLANDDKEQNDQRQMDEEYVYIDPVLGEISCDDAEHALKASINDGQQYEVRCNIWIDGEMTGYNIMCCAGPVIELDEDLLNEELSLDWLPEETPTNG